MKKFFTIVVALFTLSIVAHAEVYPQTFIISDVDYSTDTLILTDFNGFEWKYEGIEDFSINDIVSVIMEDNDTEIIFDDEIIKIRYTGYIKGWM